MANTIKIKVCGMRESNNIVELSVLRPDFIGMIFYPKSNRYVDDQTAVDIIKSIPSHIKKVGVFVNEVQSEIVKKASRFELNYIQLHGDESPEYCQELKDTGLQIIKAFGISEEYNFDNVNAYESCCDFFLFDTKTNNYGGSGNKYNWDILRYYELEKPFFLSGGIGPKDAEKILKINHKQLFALDLNSRFETKPGFKNIKQLKSFIEKLKFN